MAELVFEMKMKAPTVRAVVRRRKESLPYGPES